MYGTCKKRSLLVRNRAGSVSPEEVIWHKQRSMQGPEISIQGSRATSKYNQVQVQSTIDRMLYCAQSCTFGCAQGTGMRLVLSQRASWTWNSDEEQHTM